MFAASKTDSASIGGYEISRSLRFNDADSAYLNRTFTSAGNQKTWTWSAWVKRTGPTNPTNAVLPFFGVTNAGNDSGFFVIGALGDVISIQGWNTVNLRTTAVYRDYSAWYHIVVSLDTTQATAANRLKLYVNNVQETAFSFNTPPTLNADYPINGNVAHNIFSEIGVGSNELGGYLTEVNFIDGQALTPSSFGKTNAQTGVWQPKAFSGGAYGTNGFYLNFSDNSNTTAATLGKDYSGNGNNWTPNNFSVTAGAGNDSMVDVPTPYGVDTGAGGSVRGNYATLNPLEGITGTVTYSNGNLQALWGGTSASSAIVGTIGVSSGKWYWEVTPVGTLANLIGIANANSSPNSVKSAPNAGGYYYYDVGQKYTPTSSGGSYGASYTTGDVIGIALDMDVGTVTMYKNNVSQGVMDSSLSGLTIQPALQSATSGSGVEMICNFGQRPFAYTAPSGFKALCTQNLPTPNIGATNTTLANSFFTTNLWAGNNGVQTVTNNIDTTNGGGLIWFKARNLTINYFIVNSASGYTKYLASNNTDAEDTYDFGFAPSTTGFSFNSSSGSVNQSGYNYVAWQWKANGAGVSNTTGSITSTVSANTTSGFSVVTYTGTAVAATIGHGLGSAPSMIITKQRNGGPWAIYHKSLGIDQYMFLNSTNAVNSVTGYWGTTNPSSTVFGVIGGGYNNNSGPTVAYCFAPIEGYSAFGSYVGNGTASGPFIYCGFRPAYLLIRSIGIESWFAFDVARGTYNDNMPFLQVSNNGIEYAFDTPEIMSNGFKLSTSNGSVNGGGNTMIYAAFAEFPFKYSLAR